MAMSSRNGFWAGITLALVLAVQQGWADAPVDFAAENSESGLERYFPLAPENWQWDWIAGGYEEFKNEQTLLFGGVRAQREFSAGRLGWEWVGYAVDQHTRGSSNSGGVGMNLFLRKMFGEQIAWRPFAEIGAGIAYFDQRTPNGGSNEGTHFNFDYFAGLGLEFGQGDFKWEIGARYFHLSNADKDGADRNPSIDAIGGFAGFRWEF